MGRSVPCQPLSNLRLPIAHGVGNTIKTASDRKTPAAGRNAYGESEASSGPRPLLLRCTIFCKRTGVCLMEKIWHWPRQASPHDMTKMIQTFHQISGQLGCRSKEVNEVIFQTKIDKASQLTSGRRKQRRMERSKPSNMTSIRMITISNDYVSMGVFHQLTDNEQQKLDVHNFMVELMDDFVSQGHLQELVGLRDQLSDIAAEKPNLTVDRDDVMDTFKPFEPVVEALRAKYAIAEMADED